MLAQCRKGDSSDGKLILLNSLAHSNGLLDRNIEMLKKLICLI